MAALTVARRDKLPKSEFALPGKKGYPVDTAARARSALSRASANATPAQQAQIRAKVKREYPGMQVSKPGKGNGNSNGRNGNSNGRLANKLTQRLASHDRR